MSMFKIVKFVMIMKNMYTKNNAGLLEFISPAATLMLSNRAAPNKRVHLIKRKIFDL